MFYKGVFFGRLGKIQIALRLIDEAMRKAPEVVNRESERGLIKYLDLI